MTSDLHNYSNAEIATPIFIAVSKSQDPTIGTAVIKEVSAGGFTYREGDSVKGLTSTGPDEVYTTQLKLGPRNPATLPHGTRCVVKLQEFFPVIGETYYTAIYPVLGATVTVISPENFDVSLDLSFTKDNAKPPVPTVNNGRSSWKISDPILQGQGYFLKWSKKQPRLPFPDESKAPSGVPLAPLPSS